MQNLLSFFVKFISSTILFFSAVFDLKQMPDYATNFNQAVKLNQSVSAFCAKQGKTTQG